MSRDEPFTTPGRVIPPRGAAARERLFEFMRGHDRFLCELRDHGAQFYQNEEFLYGRRFETRALAVQWTEQERTAIEVQQE